MKNKNYTYYSKDRELLKTLADECRIYIGREYKLFDDRLVVFALPKSKKNRQVEPKSDKAERYTKRERNFG